LPASERIKITQHPWSELNMSLGIGFFGDEICRMPHYSFLVAE